MNSLHPDLAEKVLTAEIRNIITKVSQGGTLSSSARTMFHKAVLLPGLANQSRLASLLKKFASGGRLTGDELAELHAWSSNQPPLTMESLSAPVPEPTETKPDFTLESNGPRMAGSQVRYPEKQAVYAALYEVDERNLKRWVKKGREAVPIDLPPLHNPAQMPEWWARRKTNRCPAGILAAASKAKREEPPAPVATAPPKFPGELPFPGEPEEKEEKLPGRDFSEIKSLGIEENVEQLRRSLAITSFLLSESQKASDPDEGLISTRQRNYRDTFTELRKAENDLLGWQKERGLLAPLEEVRAENNRIASAIFNAVLRLYKSVRPQLHGRTDAEADAIWQNEAMACFSGLKNNKFTTFDPAEV